MAEGATDEALPSVPAGEPARGGWAGTALLGLQGAQQLGRVGERVLQSPEARSPSSPTVQLSSAT